MIDLQILLMYLRRLIAWPITWSLFWLGHFCSELAHKDDYDEENQTRVTEIRLQCLYTCYQKLMVGSSNVQDWAWDRNTHYDYVPWGKIVDEEI